MKWISIITFFIACELKVHSQEPIFFQYFMNPIYMNPALSGETDGIRFTTSHRNQWKFVPSNFATTSYSIDSWVPGPMSFSVLHLQNVEGEGSLENKYTSIGGGYRFQIKKDVKMQLGLQYQRNTRRIDWSKLVFTDNLDPMLGHVNSSSFIIPQNNVYNLNNFNFGSVVVISPSKLKRNAWKQYYQFGFAVNNLIQSNNYGFISHNFNLKRKYSFHMRTYFNPFVRRSALEAIHIPIYAQFHGPLRTYQFGLEASQAFAEYSNGTGLIGVAYRLQNNSTKLGDRIGPNESLFLRVEYSKAVKKAKYTFSFSYGFTLSELTQRSSHGIYELSLIIESSLIGQALFKLNDEKNEKRRQKNSMSCPFVKSYVFN